MFKKWCVASGYHRVQSSYRNISIISEHSVTMCFIGNITQENARKYIYTGTHLLILIAALVIMMQNWKAIQYSSNSKCINKMWHIHIMEYCPKCNLQMIVHNSRNGSQIYAREIWCNFCHSNEYVYMKFWKMEKL